MTTSTLAPPARDVPSGVVIALGSVLAVVGMSHHPSVHSHETREMFAQAVEIATLNRTVHGGLMAVIVLLLFGFTGFAQRLGLHRPLARLGLVSYAVGSLALIGAAIVNGLVFTAIAERYAERSLEEMEAARAVLVWNWEVNQALDITGVLCWSAAVLGWSLALLRQVGAWRWIGAAGTVLGLAGAGAFLSGRLAFDVHGFGLYVLAQSLWSLTVGLRLAWPARR
jgi:hypothetical protein